jgi:hypothetical protein
MIQTYPVGVEESNVYPLRGIQICRGFPATIPEPLHGIFFIRAYLVGNN